MPIIFRNGYGLEPHTVTEMIFRLVEVKGITNADSGFSLTFSDEPFDHDVELKWLRRDEPNVPMSGNWYSGTLDGQEMEGWLCPALGLFFNRAPERLFVRADVLPPAIDPIWHISRDDLRGRRFMSAFDIGSLDR